MFPQTKRSALLGSCLFALLVMVGCRDDRQPPPPELDSGAGDTGTRVDVPPPGAGGSSGRGGSAGQSGGQGGRSGQGGATGLGGSAGGPGSGGAGSGGTGSGGAGGSVDAGPDASADVPRDVGRPDVSRDTMMCGPVCAIFCPYGNVVDDNGCKTCQCNPKECKPSECAAAAAPRPLPMMCSDGTTSGTQTCERDSAGRCHWVTSTCPPEDGCSSAKSLGLCRARPTCTWLTPGCSEPKLAAAGCYERAALGCTPTSCPAGKTCTQRVIDPCGTRTAAMAAPGEALIIPPPNCDACGQMVTICL